MKQLSLLLALFTFAFFSIASSSEKVIHLFLVGPGSVGEELLKQIDERFSSEMPIEIRVHGIANSRLMHFDSAGINLKNWKSELARSNRPMSIDEFINEMVRPKLPEPVFVDCTASQLIADSYPKIFQAKISIVTPNKKPNSGLLSNYCALKTLAEQNRVPFLYDATVGAGLPFLKTIKSIKRSGDSIVKLEAILSGTLSYLFNNFDGSLPFSKLVREAQKKGYTEPDPREDLNGLDMARKFLILAREAGLMLEMSDISIEPFIPNSCFEASSISEFYRRLEEFDEQFSTLARETNQKGQVLRFMGILENGRAVLSLKAVDHTHPFYNLSDADNIASIKSQIYSRNPIVIKGPGAGASITAASVLSNIVETCAEILPQSHRAHRE